MNPSSYITTIGSRCYHFYMKKKAWIKKEQFTCPRNIQTTPHRSRGSNYWYYQQDDRFCSFCGSMHPEDFDRVIEEAIDPKNETRIVFIDEGGNGKFQIMRPWRPDIHRDSLKYHTWHWPNKSMYTEIGLQRKIGKIHFALTQSDLKFHNKIGDISMEALYGDDYKNRIIH